MNEALLELSLMNVHKTDYVEFTPPSTPEVLIVTPYKQFAWLR